MSHNYDNTRNGFNPENRFIGDIEDGKRYPFGCYSKEEADEKFALKSDLEAVAADVTVINAQIVDILQRLEALEYKAINIQSFTASPATIERGSNSTINLTWSLNKAATSQQINGVDVTGTTKQVTNISETTTFTLAVSDDKTSATKSVTVNAANQIYYGVDTDLSNVTSLTKVLSDNPARTITVNAGAGQYIIYAYPARLSDVEFWVENFEGGFEDPVTQNLTNASGYTEAYKVYRSTNANLGETTVEIKEE
jgi:hypothetical protein